MPTNPDRCCSRSTSYTVRRYDEDGNTLWIRDFFRDSNWQNTAANEPAVPFADWPLSVAATSDRIYVGGPLTQLRFGATTQAKWNLVCYGATSGTRLARRYVWDDANMVPAYAVQSNIVDVCIGQNGQVGVLTAASDYLGAAGEISESTFSDNVIFVYTQDLELVTTHTVTLGDDQGYERIEIDAAGRIHLARISYEDDPGDFQRLCVWPVDGAELIGCQYPDALAPFGRKPLRLETALGDVVWEKEISNVPQAQKINEIGLAPNGDILAAGIGFAPATSIAFGLWGRFTPDGSPLYVGANPHSSTGEAQRISSGPRRYFVACHSPTLLCRDATTDAHAWAHFHQGIQDLYAIPTGGVVTVGTRATVGKNEKDFIRESAL